MKSLESFLFENLTLIFEGEIMLNKIHRSLHDPNYISIKELIIKYGIKKILNALGRHGVAFRNDSGISTTIKWNTSAKASTEYARGAFGRTPEDFVKNINYLFNDFLQLDKEDYELSDPSIHRDVSSNSKFSIYVNLHFDGYEADFYICDNQIGGKSGEEILIRDMSCSPTKLNICDTIEDDGYDYKTFSTTFFNDLEIGLNKSLSNVLEKERYINMLLDMTKLIYNTSNEYTNTFSNNDFINLEGKPEFRYELTKEINDVYKDLDSTSKNNIATYFGEVLCGVILVNISSEFNSVKWPDNPSEVMNDLYFNGIGISVKRGSANVGHKVEIAKFARELYDLASNKNLIEPLQDAVFAKIFTKQELDSFAKHMRMFFDLDENKKTVPRSREHIVWALAFDLLKDDKDFNKVLKILKITQFNKSSYVDYVLRFIDEMDESSRNELLDLLMGNSNAYKIWNIHDWSSKTATIKNVYNGSEDVERNYSKVMHFLQLKIVDKLNQLYCSNKENQTTNLFSLVFSNLVSSKQAYIDIKEYKNKLPVVTMKIQSMNKANYMFSCAGATWQQWKSHASIGLKVKH